MSNKIKFAIMVTAYTALDAWIAFQALPQIEGPLLAATIAAFIGFAWLACVRLEWVACFRRQSVNIELPEGAKIALADKDEKGGAA
jgi:hypothetical protein